VIDPLISKRQQLLLATQLCRMVLKVCHVFLVSYSTLYFFGLRQYSLRYSTPITPFNPLRPTHMLWPLYCGERGSGLNHARHRYTIRCNRGRVTKGREGFSIDTFRLRSPCFTLISIRVTPSVPPHTRIQDPFPASISASFRVLMQNVGQQCYHCR
jgi:hypothetical protein